MNHDYVFISPDDIFGGLKSHKKYAMMTFDDGYFNNKNALPILEEYNVPAVFFVSTDHVMYNKRFWPDVLYREMIRRGSSLNDFEIELGRLMSKTTEDIEKYVMSLYGKKAFEPICDFDRPFSPSELSDFSKERNVFIGNHTCAHAILTNCSSKEVKLQIQNAQNTIYDLAGIRPIIISYPHGKYSDEIIRISREIGLKLGVTAKHRKNYLPIDMEGGNSMLLGRFSFRNDVLIDQCEIFRSDVTIYDPLIFYKYWKQRAFYRKISTR
jgi:peptidoglycan/xylan/chitin deacetylase (PgdA/CDA1 family)